MIDVVRRLPRLVWDLVLLEIGLYKALGRWIARRPDVPAGWEPLPYGRLVVPIIWLWIFGSAVEVFAVDLLLSRWWTFLRIPVLILGLWGLVWMLGLMASFRMLPHLLGEATIRVRSGARTDIHVPLAAVTGVSVAEHGAEGIRFVRVVEDRLLVLVNGNTNVQLELAPGTVLRTSQGEVAPAYVGLWVDESREVAAELRRRLPAPSR